LVSISAIFHFSYEEPYVASGDSTLIPLGVVSNGRRNLQLYRQFVWTGHLWSRVLPIITVSNHSQLFIQD